MSLGPLTPRIFPLALCLLVPVAGWAQVTLSPGGSIQAAVDQNPPGTAFTLNSGTYRLQSIQPKNGDSFVGMPGAVLNGALILSSWTAAGNVWTDPSGFTTPGQVTGYCDSAHPMCVYPEDLFFDSMPKLRVAVGNVTAGCGCWSLDYSRGTVTVGDDPAAHTVEMSITRSAFWGSATGVHISNLTVEKYAVPAQFGAIGDQYPGASWTISNSEVRWNHGAGINLASGSTASNNFVHDNGEKGIGAGGAGVLIEANEISRNNWAGFDCGWECGGVKAAQVNGYTVQGNYVHDNFGPGLWTDVDSINVLYDSNDVRHNAGGPGISHEISYAATISNNTVCYNNSGAGAQIFLSTSQNTKVLNNTITVNNVGDAIDLWQQNRGTGAYGPYALTGNSVTNNQITSQTIPNPGSPIGRVSVYWDNGITPVANTFDYNHYHYLDPGSSNYWTVATGPGYYTFANWQSIFGFDVHGAADTAVSACPAPITAGPVAQVPPVAPLIPPTIISSLSCFPNSPGSGGSSTCTVTLSQAASAAGATVTLSTNNGLLTLPASVTVPAGSNTAMFLATTGIFSGIQSALVTASYNGSSQQAVLSLVGATTVSSLSCTPATLGSGAAAVCTVTLSAVAPAGGLNIALSSDNAGLSVPALLAIPAGNITATFTATAAVVSATQAANITATYNGSSQSAPLSLSRPVLLSSLACGLATLGSGAVTTCSVSLSGPAPAGGVQVMLASSAAMLTVPASLTVPPGLSTASFNAATGAVTTKVAAIITAALNGANQTITLALLPPQPAVSQTLGSSTLAGSYFVRQVSLGIDNAGTLTDPRSVIGTLTFDGAGNYSFTGEFLAQSAQPSTLSTNGAYTLDQAGMVSLDSLVRRGDKVNARFGSEAIIGSSTESAANAFDIFVAIPAPASSAGNASLAGSYWAATLEFPSGSFANARNALFSLNSFADGTCQLIKSTGHAANQAAGQVITEQIAGATYTITPNGSGSLNFGSASNILSGTRTVYVSQDGNVLLGGSPNSHDILIGIKASQSSFSNANWAGAFWSSGLRRDSNGVTGFTGSAVASGSGNLYWTKRLKRSGSGDLDFTKVDTYSLASDGSGTSQMAQVTLGAAGNLFLGSSVNTQDPGGYEIYLGVRMPPPHGSALFLNPQGVQNAASYAPTGNPIAPGELLYLYVSGLSVTSQTADPPYPASLGGVTVLINGKAAPLYLVSPSEIVALVPFATTGSTASIVVQSGGASSNTVTVPLAPTAPGIFSLAENGAGFGAIRHADYSVVTADNPAHSGEIVQIYLTGLGPVSPPVADGFGGAADPLSVTAVSPTVTVGGSAAAVLFSGLSGYPGLYQINAQLPVIPAGTTALPVVITTPNAFHDQVSVAVAP